MREGRKLIALLVVGAVLCGAGLSSAAEVVEEWDEGHPSVVWVGVAVTNIFYAPAKLAYAAGGGIVGGLTWLFGGGDTEAANSVWDSSVRGTYLITPSMLEGREDVRFFGP